MDMPFLVQSSILHMLDIFLFYHFAYMVHILQLLLFDLPYLHQGSYQNLLMNLLFLLYHFQLLFFGLYLLFLKRMLHQFALLKFLQLVPDIILQYAQSLLDLAQILKLLHLLLNFFLDIFPHNMKYPLHLEILN